MESTIVNEAGEITDPYRGFIATSRYARWDAEKGRRETWVETVQRYIGFMRNHVNGQKDVKPLSEEFWAEAEEAIVNHDVMPSMRALMTAGKALEREHLAQYNCAFLAIDDPRAFDEAVYILMNGVGVGFSVESRYVSKLPTVGEHFSKSDSTIVVADTKMGWARAVRELIAMSYAGQVPSIDVTRIRPTGAPLKTFGGRASGPQPLVDLFDFIIETFKGAAGRQLTTLECHDIMCKIGDIVVSGGVRRSALISLSDPTDYKMATAKSGAWWEDNVQRALANNSAAYHGKPGLGEFLRQWSSLYESKSGERGIVNMDGLKRGTTAPRRDMSRIQGVNPCGEILLRSQQLCNLTEVIVEPDDDRDELMRKVRIATTLGTIQSSLTNFKYLRKAWRDNCEEERLLGVSLTGQMSHGILNGQEGVEELRSLLSSMKELSIEVNAEVAGVLGINPSTAITTVKPSGTVSQLTNSSSGMHPWHSLWYARSVRGNNTDPMTAFMKYAGVPNEPDVTKPDVTTVFTFPIKAPEGALTRSDLTAIEHLNIWKEYKNFWTEHNPSVTISVREEEWAEVAAWVYANWNVIGGVSFLPYSDHTYRQAPYQELTDVEYKELVSRMPEEIIWSDLSFYEDTDGTSGSQTLACTSNSCELVDINAA